MKFYVVSKNIVAFFIVLGLGLVGAKVFAQTLNVDYPLIPIPGPGGIRMFDINKALAVGKLTIKQLIILIYGAIVLFSGILAFVTLLYAGLVYIVSGGNPGRRKAAFQRFKNIWIGLGIILVSFFILNIINPNITDLDKSLVLKPVSIEGNNFLGFGFTAENSEELIARLEKERGTYSCQWKGGSCLPKGTDTCKEGFYPNCEGVDDSTACGDVIDSFCDGSGIGGGDPSIAGTFDCIKQDDFTCIAPIIPMPEYKCTTPGYIPDTSKCVAPGLLGCPKDLTCISEEAPTITGTFYCGQEPGESVCTPTEADENTCKPGYVTNKSICDAFSPGYPDFCGEGDIYRCIKAP